MRFARSIELARFALLLGFVMQGCVQSALNKSLAHPHNGRSTDPDLLANLRVFDPGAAIGIGQQQNMSARALAFGTLVGASELLQSHALFGG